MVEIYQVRNLRLCEPRNTFRGSRSPAAILRHSARGGCLFWVSVSGSVNSSDISIVYQTNHETNRLDWVGMNHAPLDDKAVSLNPDTHRTIDNSSDDPSRSSHTNQSSFLHLRENFRHLLHPSVDLLHFHRAHLFQNIVRNIPALPALRSTDSNPNPRERHPPKAAHTALEPVVPPRAPANLELYFPQRTLELIMYDDQLRPRAIFVGQVPQEGLPRGGQGGTADVHEGGRLPEGDVVTAAGEEAVAVETAFGEGRVGEVVLEGGQ